MPGLGAPADGRWGGMEAENYCSDDPPTQPSWCASSGVGSRFWFSVIFLNGDGAALFLPGAAVRARLSRHHWAFFFVCGRRMG